MKSALTLFGFLSLLTQAAVPQLAATNRHVCLLSENQELRCWTQWGKIEPYFLTFNAPYRCPDYSSSLCWGPRNREDFERRNWRTKDLALEGRKTTAIAATGGTICAVQEGRLTCRGAQHYGNANGGEGPVYDFGQNIETAFAGFSEIRKIAADDAENFCVWDAGKRAIECATPWHADVPTKSIAMDEEPREMAVASQTLCAILADGSLHCWGPAETGLHPADAEASLLKVPSSLKKPRDLSIADRRACVIDQGEFRCWGKWEKQMVPTLKAENDSLFPYAFSVRSRNWLDAGKVHIPDSACCDTPVRDSFRMTDAVLGASRGARYCAADPKSISCTNGPSFEHHTSLNFRPAGEMEALLKSAAAASYAGRRAVFLSAATLLHGRSDATQAFVFRALAPLVQGATSTIFETGILPRYNRALTFWGPRAGSIDENVEVALRLLLWLIPPGEGDAWASLKGAVGVALAEKASPRSLASLKAASRAMQPTFTAAKASSRTAPLVRAIGDLLALLAQLPA